jgi:hypothetical protein
MEERKMAEQTLHGSCLCKSVRYEVSTPFMRFGHCYCSRCRKATGGVRSTNIAVPIAQFRWTQGENLIKRYDLPEAKSFARQICATLRTHADGTRAIVPAGTFDDVPPANRQPRPLGSRVPWWRSTVELPCESDKCVEGPLPLCDETTRACFILVSSYDTFKCA